MKKTKTRHTRPDHALAYQGWSIRIRAEPNSQGSDFIGLYSIRLRGQRGIGRQAVANGARPSAEEAEDAALWAAILRIDGICQTTPDTSTGAFY